jgi:hypothetical protein
MVCFNGFIYEATIELDSVGNEKEVLFEKNMP